jgi:hypothetical protein
VNIQRKKVSFTKTGNDRSWTNAFATLAPLSQDRITTWQVVFASSYIKSLGFGIATQQLDLSKDFKFIR